MTHVSHSSCVVSVHSKGTHDFSKQPRPFIRLIANFGVEGDAHAGATDQHLYHIRRFVHQPNLRQVHVIQGELFDDVLTKGHTVHPGDLGENITTRGVDLLALPTGTRLHFGNEAVIELTGLRNPCVQIENFQPGLLQHMVEHQRTWLVRKAGVMSIVVKGGLVRPDDQMRVETPPLPHDLLIYRVPVLDLRITAIRYEAEDTHSLELLAPDQSRLPPFTAGAHIDLALSDGLTRSYSLCNAPSERHRYMVCVKKQPASRGGSKAVHEKLRVGDRIQVSPPRNNFALDESVERTVLIAGGIGITPLKAMIVRIDSLGRQWQLHYAARNPASMAFHDELQALAEAHPGSVHLNFSDTPVGKRLDLPSIVLNAPAAAHFYCCGPESMIEAFNEATNNLPRSQVHIERFGNAGAAATEGGFKVILQRTQKALEVPRGSTILDTLLHAGVDIPYSCKEEVCGSSKVKVLAGTPDHRDVALSPDEHARNDQIISCCSGSKTASLVLDL